MGRLRQDNGLGSEGMMRQKNIRKKREKKRIRGK